MRNEVLPERAPASNKESRGANFAARALDEALRFAVMFLYLWVLLGVFVLHEHIILQSRHVSVVWDGFAAINALVLAKVMLLAEELDLGRWLPRRPLLYPILFDALFLTVLFIVFHILEHRVVAWLKGDSGVAENGLGGGGVGGLLSVAVILLVSLIPFFAFRHVSRELGPGRMRAMLLGTERDAAQGSAARPR